MIVDQGAGVFFPRMEGIAWGVQYKNALDDKRFNLQFGQNTLCTDLFFRGGGISAMYLHFRENGANKEGPLLLKFLYFWFSNKRIR